MNASIYTIDLKRKAPISHSSLVSQAPGCPDCSRLVGALSPKYLQQTQVTQRHLWVWTVRAQSILARHCLSHLPHCKRVCQSGLWIEWTRVCIYIYYVYLSLQMISAYTYTYPCFKASVCLDCNTYCIYNISRHTVSWCQLTLRFSVVWTFFWTAYLAYPICKKPKGGDGTTKNS